MLGLLKKANFRFKNSNGNVSIPCVVEWFNDEPFQSHINSYNLGERILISIIMIVVFIFYNHYRHSLVWIKSLHLAEHFRLSWFLHQKQIEKSMKISDKYSHFVDLPNYVNKRNAKKNNPSDVIHSLSQEKLIYSKYKKISKELDSNLLSYDRYSAFDDCFQIHFTVLFLYVIVALIAILDLAFLIAIEFNGVFRRSYRYHDNMWFAAAVESYLHVLKEDSFFCYTSANLAHMARVKNLRILEGTLVTNQVDDESFPDLAVNILMGILVITIPIILLYMAIVDSSANLHISYLEFTHFKFFLKPAMRIFQLIPYYLLVISIIHGLENGIGY